MALLLSSLSSSCSPSKEKMRLNATVFAVIYFEVDCALAVGGQEEEGSAQEKYILNKEGNGCMWFRLFC